MSRSYLDDRKKIISSALIGLTVVSGFVLMGLQAEPAGWLLLATAVAATWFSRDPSRRHLLPIQGSLILLGLTPIDTNIALWHMVYMGTTIALAVAIPAYLSIKIYRDGVIRFPFRTGRRWYRSEILYILFTAAVAYLILPFYFHATGAYHNWPVLPGARNLITLFIGTNGLGIWDELFFVATVMATFRCYLDFKWANLAQAVLWTSFLYDLGFTGWAPLLIFPFAMLQGYIFRRTDSLIYIITIHLTLDLVLYLTLIHAYYPAWMPIFITG